MNRSPLRLVQKRWKALYIVGGLIACSLIFRLIRLIPSDIGDETLITLINFAWIYYATRIFRGGDELLVPPRAWWRMTARPRAGFLLGAFWILGIVGAIANLFKGQLSPITNWSSIIELAVLAYLYFASSIRLRQANSVATRSTVA